MKHHQRGDLSELIAAAAMRRKGYKIFWPFGHPGHVDFVACSKVKAFRVQVKTTFTRKGKRSDTITCSIVRGNVYGGDRRYSKDDFDYVALVSRRCEVWLLPWSRFHKTKAFTVQRAGRGKDLRPFDRYLITKKRK